MSELSTIAKTARPELSYSSLAKRLRSEGVMDRRVGTYLVYGSFITALLALGLYLMMAMTHVGAHVLGALVLAFTSVHFGSLTHDADHGEIVSGRAGNRVLGIVTGNLLSGISFAWWSDKHGRHHRAPNDPKLDPDLYDFFAYSREQAVASRGIYRVVARYQAVLFWPMAAFSAACFRVLSLRYAASPATKSWPVELTLLVIFHIWYTGAFFWSSSVVEGAILFVLSQAVTGLYLTCVFLPNHVAMPLTDVEGGSDTMTLQVVPTRDIQCGPILGFLFIGLHHQIEHHLFPDMPRWNLPRATEATEAACRSHGLPFRRVGTLAAFAQIAQHLHEVGAPLRRSS